MMIDAAGSISGSAFRFGHAIAYDLVDVPGQIKRATDLVRDPPAMLFEHRAYVFNRRTIRPREQIARLSQQDASRVPKRRTRGAASVSELPPLGHGADSRSRPPRRFPGRNIKNSAKQGHAR
jgi:hypothetical protein